MLASNRTILSKRYIYCNELEFKPSELYEIALVAEKYLVHHMLDALIDRVREQLNGSTCFLIYDQLSKLQLVKTDLLLFETREFIKSNSQAAFKSDLFLQIDQDTLIDLLNFEQLSISEIDLLKACSKWVEFEVMRSKLPPSTESKKAAFLPIRHLIRWSDLNPFEVASFGEIHSLLNDKEIASLLMHLLNKSNPLAIDWQPIHPSRNAGLSCVVFRKFGTPRSLFTYQMLVKVDKEVYVKIIRTGIQHVANLPDPTLSILSHGAVLNLKVQKFIENSKWCFKFADEFALKPDSDYQFFLQQKSLAPALWSNENPVLVETFSGFTFSNVNTWQYGFHLIEKIEFL